MGRHRLYRRRQRVDAALHRRGQTRLPEPATRLRNRSLRLDGRLEILRCEFGAVDQGAMVDNKRLGHVLRAAVKNVKAIKTRKKNRSPGGHFNLAAGRTSYLS
jgi:hypothetical protein